MVDSGNNAVRKISSTGAVTTLAGGTSGFANGTGAAAKFNNPSGIAIDGAGNLYVADTGNNVIRKITPAGAVTTFSGNTGGNTGTSLGEYNSPEGVIVDSSNNVYVTDTLNHRVIKLSNTGSASLFAGGTLGIEDGTGATAKFYNPRSLTRDGEGNIWVADYNVIRMITPTGTVTTPDMTGASLTNPVLAGATAGGNPTLYVADAGKHLIYSIDKSPNLLTATTLAGAANLTGTAEGTGTAARFNGPNGLVVLSAGKIYVSDTQNHRIRKIQ